MVVMGAYEDSLQHIAEPASPSEREQTPSATLDDYVALWFTTPLREFAHYEADAPHSTIAVGLASYIDTKVRDEGTSNVAIYAHTDEAIETIIDALDHGAAKHNPTDIPGQVSAAVGQLDLEQT
jgi:hypothetical protein